MKRPPTPFEQKVYDAIRLVPKGNVTTYGLIGRHIRCASSQAIGQALRRNPFAPAVPCHRVIASDLTIGGFAGHRDGAEIRRKLRMLRDEDVAFVDGRLADPARLHRF